MWLMLLLVLEFGPHACRARTSLQYLFSPSFCLLLQLCLGAGIVLTFKSLSLAGHSIVCAQTQCLGGRGLCERPAWPHREFQASQIAIYGDPVSGKKKSITVLTIMASLNPSSQPGQSLTIPSAQIPLRFSQGLLSSSETLSQR